jgi:hypothetical protein
MMLPVVDALSSMSLSPSNIPPLKPAPVPQHNSDDRFAIHDPSAAMQPAPPHVVPDRSELIAAALQTTVNAGEQQCGEPSDAGDDGTTPLAAKMVEQQNPQANLQQLDARAHQAPLMQSELAPLNIPPGYQFLPVQQQQQALTLTSSARPYAKIRAHRTFALKCRFRPVGNIFTNNYMTMANGN